MCKFVGTPGDDERLQTGQNPISVSVNSIPDWDGVIGSFFADQQGRSKVIAFDIGQPEPSVFDCLPTPGTTTTSSSTTSTPSSTSTSSSTTTTQAATTTTIDRCPNDDCTPGTVIATTTTSTTEVPTSTTSTTTGPSTSTTSTSPPTSTTVAPTTSSSVAPTSTTSSPPSTSTTTTSTPSTSPPPSSTSPTTSTTTAPTSTTSTSSTTLPTTSSTATTLPETFTFGAAGTVCVREVPTIRIEFQNLFPSLAGRTGTLTMTSAATGEVVSTQSLVYEPGTTVDILYPGTEINPDGSVADVPGWNLNSDGFWVQDPTDAFLREGIFLTYELNPTAGPVLVEYPPESSACANPDGPFPPGPTTTVTLPPFLPPTV